MDLKQIEAKWQKKWEETGLYKFNRDNVKDKYYVLEMFSYPSGAKLHAGHWFNYGPPTALLVSSVCRALRFFTPWALTHLVCQQKTTQSKQVFTQRIAPSKTLKQWSNS